MYTKRMISKHIVTWFSVLAMKYVEESADVNCSCGIVVSPAALPGLLLDNVREKMTQFEFCHFWIFEINRPSDNLSNFTLK